MSVPELPLLPQIARYIALVVGMWIFVMLYLWQSIAVTRIELDCARLERERTALLRRNDELQAAKARYAHPELAARYAIEHGLGRPLPGGTGKIDLKNREQSK
jgi:hypothetical protein